MTDIQNDVRIPQSTIAALDEAAKREHRIRLDLALRLYREGQVSKSRAAEIAGVSLWEVMDWSDQAEFPGSYTLAEATEDIKSLIARTPQIA